MKTINTSHKYVIMYAWTCWVLTKLSTSMGLNYSIKCVCLQVYATELLHSLKNCQCIDGSELYLISRLMVLLIRKWRLLWSFMYQSITSDQARIQSKSLTIFHFRTDSKKKTSNHWWFNFRIDVMPNYE